jgi:hypothetical protein
MKNSPRTNDAQTALCIRSLFGEPLSETERGKLLHACRAIRADMAWMRVGCYGWLIHKDILKTRQRKLLEWRKSQLT